MRWLVLRWQKEKLVEEFDFKEFGVKLKKLVAQQVAEIEATGPRPRVFNPNSAEYWLRKITEDPELNFHIPESVFIPYDHSKLIAQLEGEEEYTEWEGILSSVDIAATAIGYPVFVRTDLSSDKHGGIHSFLIEEKEHIGSCLELTASDNEMKFWTAQGPESFVIRKYLDLNYDFIAFHGLPIAREWRFFATRDQIICDHPYWPEESIQFFGDVKEPRNWKELLKTLQTPPPDFLQDLAKKAASLCDVHDKWSVDFAEDQEGKWWLIDMAIAEQSWHWPECRKLEEMQNEYQS